MSHSTNVHKSAKKPPLQAPFYVVIFGITFGTTIGLAKLGAIEGLPPMSLVFWQMLGAGIFLGIVATLKGQRPKLLASHLRYYIIAGILGNAVPTTIAFTASAKIGTGITGLVYPLSTVFTYTLAVFFGMDTPQPKKIAGLVLGLVGALTIIGSPLLFVDTNVIGNASFFWLALIFTIPIFLACGNIYRTKAWPPNTGSLPLASGMMIATAILLLPALFASDSFQAPDFTGSTIDWIILGSTSLSIVGFIAYFELQRIAGPVYFSQISYFITITTVAFGIFVFDETLTLATWIAIGFIFGGLYMVSKSQK
ncbi:MAG: DMT family transporter [Sneathiella sp.]|nr:DMT family transporter [Sneathiella sp.]